MPTPLGQLTEKYHEINYMKSNFTGLHQRDNTFQDYTARESRSAAAEATLDSERFVCDIEQPPDVKSGAMQQAGEESKCNKIDAESFDWSSGANISEETKEYIGKIMGRGLQRRLRSKTRNKAFRKPVVVTRLRRPLLLCELDDIVVVYDSSKKQVFHWFVNMEDGELTARERNFLHNIQRWEPLDCGRCTEAIIEATKELESIGAMIRYLLG